MGSDAVRPVSPSAYFPEAFRHVRVEFDGVAAYQALKDAKWRPAVGPVLTARLPRDSSASAARVPSPRTPASGRERLRDPSLILLSPVLVQLELAFEPLISISSSAKRAERAERAGY